MQARCILPDVFVTTSMVPLAYTWDPSMLKCYLKFKPITPRNSQYKMHELLLSMTLEGFFSCIVASIAPARARTAYHNVVTIKEIIDYRKAYLKDCGVCHIDISSMFTQDMIETCFDNVGPMRSCIRPKPRSTFHRVHMLPPTPSQPICVADLFGGQITPINTSIHGLSVDASKCYSTPSKPQSAVCESAKPTSNMGREYMLFQSSIWSSKTITPATKWLNLSSLTTGLPQSKELLNTPTSPSVSSISEDTNVSQLSHAHTLLLSLKKLENRCMNELDSIHASENYVVEHIRGRGGRGGRGDRVVAMRHAV